MGKQYRKSTISIHWLAFFLIIGVYASIELRVFFEKGTDMRDAFKMWHFMLGLTVLLSLVVRIMARLAGTTPEISPQPPQWQMIIAKIAILTLYFLMIFLPITGWLMLSAKGKVIPFFGLELPALISPDKDLGKQIKEIHVLVATFGYYLIGLHMLAALYHHFFLKDNTLKRMLNG